ncbi:copper chaperone [Cerasibacillus quisquiliarum]|uniref:Copper chaperone CopZ n=1 Tax=Cerasibacillus quisquiliarum TaxID=227865 RepID=A0A511V5F0_9BACI|nr:cation transporter [Cerasibacillus quisquiliarum]MBB5147401.1 copper chaperone [Cerasibacillus quisquiliarum]GEN32422.1 copper chaperone CopZ [Cerasibacillus quisquiliarum]
MKTTLKVQGMTCEHCEAAVKGALEGIEGVTQVEVHLTSGEVDVTHKSDVHVQALRDAVEDQGYDVEQ